VNEDNMLVSAWSYVALDVVLGNEKTCKKLVQFKI
jgi:hypothetical protein